MKTLATLVLVSCAGTMLAQDPPDVPALTKRIGSFAGEAKRTLTILDPTVETERTCAQYAWIDSTARLLAAEVRAAQAEVPYPASEVATAQALAYYYKDSDPQLACYYQYTGIQAYTQAILANSPPTGHNSLVAVSELARQASKAKSAVRLARVHNRLAKRVAELEDLMASR